MPDTKDKGASANKVIYEKVKKGDYLLVPRIPEWDDITIVEATKDWKEGYEFSISKEKEDYGHIFPAEIRKIFKRNNINIPADIRSTLKTPKRFWNITRLGEDVENILKISDEELKEETELTKKVEKLIKESFEEVFSEEKFLKKSYNKLIDRFQASEWEEMVRYGLEILYPNYLVEKVGGFKEKEHGTDVLVKIPNFMSKEEYYVIAIQIKDYKGKISSQQSHNIVEQVKKSEYWKEIKNNKIIDKVLLITSAKREDNSELEGLCKNEGIKLMFGEDFESLIREISQKYIGYRNEY